MYEEMLPLCLLLEEKGEDFLEQAGLQGEHIYVGLQKSSPDPTEPHSIAAALRWYSDGHVT